MPSADLDGVSLYYEECSAVGVPILFCGGFAGQLLNFPDGPMAELGERGLRPIRLDLRDSGLSTRFPAGPDYTLHDCAADLVALADHLGLERFHLLGAGFGGMVAQVAAIDHPERIASLVLVNTSTAERGIVGFDGGIIERLYDVVTPARDRRLHRRRYLAFVEATACDDAVGAGELERFVDRLAERDPALTTTQRYFGSVGITPPWAHRLRDLPMPVLIMHGARNPFLTIAGGRRTAALIDHAKFIAIEGMGHYLSSTFWNVAIEAIAAHVTTAEHGAPR